MGIVMIPDISSDQIAVTLQLEDDVEKEDAYAVADQVMERVLQVDHVDTVGALAGDGDSLALDRDCTLLEAATMPTA